MTSDTDFGTISALTGAGCAQRPALHGVGDSVSKRVGAILDVLARIEDELSQGAVVVIEEDRYRIR